MTATSQVLIGHLGQLASSKTSLEPNESRPKPTVNVRDLSIHQLADENVRARRDELNESKDPSTMQMRPPATVNRFACDKVGQVWHRPASRLKHNTVSPDEC